VDVPVSKQRNQGVDVDAVIWSRTVALRMMAFRQAKGITQERLAKAVGLTRTSIVNIEAQRQAITLPTLYALGKALGVNPKRLLP
jgi:DNA-binding XRE family transcriptional regulator